VPVEGAAVSQWNRVEETDVMIEKLSVADGKYTFSVPDGDWRVHVERGGEP
jgi:hypothetical protein